ncbi:MAG: CHAT domain-containing protein [Nostoc sp. EkiNYC01]|nr:CHAT domain-containing protein [Nostoc sp. EkiNYC01]
MIRFRYFLKYLLLGILALTIAVNQPSLILAQEVSKQAQQYQAEVLNHKGQRQLDRGQAAEALKTWQQATKLYQQQKDSEGIAGSLINENVALQTLGLYPRACTTLLKALKLDAWICATSLEPPVVSTQEALKAAINKVNPTSVNLLGLQNLGNVLSLIGKLNESETVLQETLTLAQQVQLENTSDILLSLANTEQLIYRRLQEQYQWIEEPLFQETIVNFLPEKALASLEIYQIIENTPQTSQAVKLQAQLNRLSLLLDFNNWLNTKYNLIYNHAKINDITQQIQLLVNQLLKNHSAFSQLSAEQSIYAKLKFAYNLNQIPNKQLHLSAIEYAQQALQIAKSLNNQRLESSSLGMLGELQTELSQTYFEQALGLAQSVQAWDLAYEWQQQLGSLYDKSGKPEQARIAYAAAIDNLTQVRDNLLTSNADLQFSFYEQVEPVYRNYIRLLLREQFPDLERVIETIGQFQIAELENFLQCGKLNLVALNQIQNVGSAVLIYIIDLNDTIEVIVQTPGRSPVHHSVDSKLVKIHVNALLDLLQDKRLVSTKERIFISHYQALYNQLIAPVKKYLPPSGTLVFTLDRAFQSLPMHLLHDGKDYLVKQYSFSETLGSRIRPPKFLQPEQFKALIAGLSKTSPSFADPNAPQGTKPLPQAKQEVKDVQKQTQSSLTLLDENFTSQQFGQELSKDNFPIVHVTTHGQFSSDPKRTVILAYDKAINVLEFESLLRSRTIANTDTIELLVLSACQTAKGNKRSALGIAGVSAQAGARSTIATLWLVDAKSTTLFMEEFYQGLRNKLSKAEALRLAQISLMSNPEYSHPYYWAPFLLVGSWL